MKPRSIKIVQTTISTGRERTAELCWRYLCIISDGLRATENRKTPEGVLDALLWGDTLTTTRFAYRIEH